MDKFHRKLLWISEFVVPTMGRNDVPDAVPTMVRRTSRRPNLYNRKSGFRSNLINYSYTYSRL